MKQNLKSYLYPVSLVIVTLGFSVSLQSVLAAWTAPTAAPTGGNVSAPINTGSANQTMLGGLGVGGAFSVTGNSSFTGNVGIGTTSPAQKLDVNGNISAWGSYYYGDGKIMFQYTDTWLRLNPSNAFSSGIYAGTGISRTDGTLQVGASGGTLNVVSGGDLAYRTNVLFANTAGNVGIGTASPGAKLDVSGNIKALGSSVFAQSDNTNKAYNYAPIQLREAQYGATSAYLPPRISFHWGGVVASQIGIESNGRLAVLDNPGTGYENLVAKNVYASGDFLENGNYGLGLVGWYSPTRYSNVYSMGAGYRLATDGTGSGNLYGIAYSYEPNYGGAGNNAQAKAGLGHQYLVMANGVTQTAIGTGIWTNGNLTFGAANPTISASSYFIAPGGAYFNSGTVYTEAAIQARGGIHNDTNTYLSILGGTSGNTYFSGNIGIGNASPTGKLEITSKHYQYDSSVYGQLLTPRCACDTGWGYECASDFTTSDAPGSVCYDQYQSSFGWFTIRYSKHFTAYDTVLYAGSTGNVGIGTANPASRLDVRGNVSVSGSGNFSGSLNASSPTGNVLTKKTYYAYNGASRGTTTVIPLADVIGFCGDGDGCHVRLGMTCYDTSCRTASREFLFYTDSSGSYWRASSDTAGQNSNGATEHVYNAWSCYFTDGAYSAWADLGDASSDFGFMSWNQYDATCILTLVD